MGNLLPDISVEWDDAHAKALGPELSTYRRIVNRLGSRDGVETSFGASDSAAGPWSPGNGAAADSAPAEPGRAGADEGVMGDIHEMRRSLNRLSELGARITINGQPADSVALDDYEDTLCREIHQSGLDDEDTPAATGCGYGSVGGGLLSSIITFVGLVVVLRWFFG